MPVSSPSWNWSARGTSTADARRGFAGKCAAYLQRGIGLIVADIVTVRRANLHNELMRLLEAGDAIITCRTTSSSTPSLTAPPGAGGQSDRPWPVALTVGGTLPLLPLALRGTRAVPLDLEKTYSDARERSRL